MNEQSNDFGIGYAVGRDTNNCGYGNGFGNGMFGGDWAWWIIILLIFGWGGNGYGFGGGFGGGAHCGSACATQADLAAGFNNSAVLNNLNDLKLGQAGIQQTLCQGFNGVNTAILQGFNGVDNAVCTLGYNMQAGVNGLSRQIAECCCTTASALADVKYSNERNTCDIIRAGQDNTRAILDFLTNDKISTLTAENQALKFQASQTAQNAFITANNDAQTAELIRRLCPQPTPAYVVQPPQPVTFATNCCGGTNVAGYGYNGGCGCGCN
jgi:hypothetical protein